MFTGLTVVSEKNGTFIRELILERYIYLSMTTKNHKFWSEQKSPRISSSLEWSLFETSRIIIIEVRRFGISMF